MRGASGIAGRSLMAALCVFAAGAALSQEFPSKPVRMVVPNTPGTLYDSIARILSPDMSRALGQPVVVEYKPGAGNMIGYEYVAKQVPADGYTVLMGTTSTTAILPLTAKNIRFDPLKDLPPIIGLVEGRLFFGSPAQLPWKTLNEMIAYAKANPGKLNYGSSAPNTRLATEAFTRSVGLNVVHVPYSAAAAYYLALVSGDVQMGFVNEATTASFGPKFRVIAVTGDQRVAQYPEAPTFTELGYPQIRSLGFVLHAPVGVPKPALDKLYAAAYQALQQPESKAQYAKLKLEVLAQSPEVAAKNLVEEARLFADIAKKIGLQPE